MEKYCTARQATDDNITCRKRFAFWITKVTDIHSEYVILLSRGNNVYPDTSHCYVTCTLSYYTSKLLLRLSGTTRAASFLLTAVFHCVLVHISSSTALYTIIIILVSLIVKQTNAKLRNEER